MRISDWSSDVCSSDLPHRFATGRIHSPPFPFVTFSCNSDAMTSNSSQDPTDPTALVDDILAELQTAFRTSVTNLKSALAAYFRARPPPPADAAAPGLLDYPAIRLTTTSQPTGSAAGKA